MSTAVARFERSLNVWQLRATGQETKPSLQEFGRNLFQSLWRLDFLAMALNTDPYSGYPNSDHVGP